MEIILRVRNVNILDIVKHRKYFAYRYTLNPIHQMLVQKHSKLNGILHNYVNVCWTQLNINHRHRQVLYSVVMNTTMSACDVV